MQTRRRSTPAVPSRVMWLVPPFLAVAIAQLCLLARRSAAFGGLLPVNEGWSNALWLLLQLAALSSVLMLVWRLVLVTRYRATPSVADGQLPSVTVIVPAYNEGQQVYETLRSLVDSDYPRDRLQIVAVDDGSVDDTWQWIQRGATDFGPLVTTLRCRVNRGKRFALHEGFARSRGEIIVTVDSDSEVLSDTVRNLVSPFVVDPRVGAVAGNVRVLNDTGVFGRMLDVAFTYAFEFVRASESMVDTVSCCPGALSAFRKPLLDACKDEWLAQTFLGRPANIGEDRALTNFVLRAGYLVRFQSNAIVLTEVPRRLPQLCRMLLRWDRSNIRESLWMGQFVFKRFRPESAWGARVNFVWSVWEMALQLQAVLILPVLVLTQPVVLGWVALGLMLGAVLPASVFAVSGHGLRALWAFPYAVFSALFLAWITPYAFLTPHCSSWLTRVKTPVAEPELHEAAVELAA
jgi:hyaluronan synthase